MIDTDRCLREAERRDFENREGDPPEDEEADIRELGEMFHAAYPRRSERYCREVAAGVLTSIDVAVRESNLVYSVLSHLSESERTKLAPLVYLRARLRDEVNARIDEMVRGR